MSQPKRDYTVFCDWKPGTRPGGSTRSSGPYTFEDAKNYAYQWERFKRLLAWRIVRNSDGAVVMDWNNVNEELGMLLSVRIPPEEKTNG